MKKALITGIAGFAGSHLAEHLISNNIAVYGIYHPDHSVRNIEHIKSKLNLIACDLFDESSLKKNFPKTQFDYIFHLAAFSSPSQSFKNPRETMENNILGQINLLDMLVGNKSNAKILIIGSSEEYGEPDKKYLPLSENTPFAPNSPYAVSKVGQDLLGYQYFLNKNLKIVRVRPFNHAGPRQSDAFVLSAFAKKIVKLEKSNENIIKVGNLETYRDFTDVRDMVKAYLLALEKGKLGEVYNIGSGKKYKIKSLLNQMISLSTKKIDIQIDKSLFRPADTKIVYCDATKFKKATGWKPKIPIAKTLSDTINYERENN